METNIKTSKIQPDDLDRIIKSLLYPINAASHKHKRRASFNLSSTTTSTPTSAESVKTSFPAMIPFAKKISGTDILGRPIVPPSLPISAPTSVSETRSLLEHLQKALSIYREDVERTLDESIAYTYPDVSKTDLNTYRILVEKGLLEPSSGFSNVSDLEKWKSSEVEACEQLCNLHNQLNGSTPSLNSINSTLFMLQVKSASGLVPKDANGSSNPYCLISSDDRGYVSLPTNKTIHPQWPGARFVFFSLDTPIIISIWNYPSKAGQDHAFLGVVTVEPQQMMKQMNSGDFTLALQKRTHKSRVSGFLTLSLTSLDSIISQFSGATSPSKSVLPRNQLYSLIFYTLPQDPYGVFFKILSSCLTYDLTNNSDDSIKITGSDGHLSPETETILGTLAAQWRIRISFRQAARFHVYVNLFEQGLISASTLYHQGYLKFLKQRQASQLNALTIKEQEIWDKSFSTLKSIVPFQIRQFFMDGPGKTMKEDPVAYLEAILSMYIGIEDSLSPSGARLGTRVTDILVPILEARSYGLEAVANTSETPLLTLAESILKELLWIRSSFDMLLFETVHIPSLAAKAFQRCLLTRLTDFSRTYKAKRPDMSDAFELYMTMKRLLDIYSEIDFRIAEQFESMDWFESFLEEWFRTSDKKTFEWVKNSFDVDTVMETMFHSSSVLDIFTCFQQQMDFIIGLQWPNAPQNKAMVARIVQQCIKGIDQYLSLLKHAFDAHMAAYKPPKTASNSNLAPVKKIVKATNRMGKVVQRNLRLKKGRGNSNQQLQRFDPKALVILENLLAIIPRMEIFLSTIPRNLIQCPTTERAFLGTENQIPLQIKLIRLENNPIQPPWAIKNSFKLVSCMGREIGRTRQRSQRLCQKWNHVFRAILTEREYTSDIQLGWMNHVTPEMESIRRLVPLSVSKWGLAYSEVPVPIDLGSLGVVHLSASFVNELDTEFYLEKVSDMALTVMDKSVRSLSRKICSEFIESVHEVSLLYKQNPMIPLIKNMKTAHSSSSPQFQDRVQEDLSPCFDLLDSNFGFIMETMSEEHALLVIRWIWKDVLERSEELIVPSLNDGTKEQKPWDENRLQFFVIYFETLEEFFLGDGEGMSRESIQIPEYIRLKRILEWYNASVKSLQDEFIRIRASHASLVDGCDDDPANMAQNISGHDEKNEYDFDAILKLLKMRGETSFVQAELRQRAIISE